MSDIKTAAQWMKEGFNVRRKSWLDNEFSLHLGSLGESFPLIVNNHDESFNQLDCDDLLASDWEIVK